MGDSYGESSSIFQDSADFSQIALMKRLDQLRDYAKKLNSTPAPKTGYLDTQLFEKKKKIK